MPHPPDDGRLLLGRDVSERRRPRRGVILGAVGGPGHARLGARLFVDHRIHALEVHATGSETLSVQRVRAALELEVSLLAPPLAEGVLQDPVLDQPALDPLLTPPGDHHRVIDGHDLRVGGVRGGAAVLGGDDSARVELKHLVGVDANRHRLLRNRLHQRLLPSLEIQLAVPEHAILQLQVRGAVAVGGAQAGLDGVQHPPLVLGAQFLEIDAELSRVRRSHRRLADHRGARVMALTQTGGRGSARGRLGAHVRSRGGGGGGGGAVESARSRQTAILVNPLVGGEHVPRVAPAVVTVAVDELLRAELHVLLASAGDDDLGLDGVRGGVGPAGGAGRLLGVDLAHHLGDVGPVEVLRVARDGAVAAKA